MCTMGSWGPLFHESLEIGVWCVVPLVLHPKRGAGRWPSNSSVLQKNQSNRSLAIFLLAGCGWQWGWGLAFLCVQCLHGWVTRKLPAER